MEELILSEGQCERFIMETLVDYGFGYPEEMVFRTIIDEDEHFHFELTNYTFYHGEKTETTHLFKVKDYIELLKHSLNKHGYDTNKVYAYVRHGKLKVKVQTNIATPGYTYGKRRKR